MDQTPEEAVELVSHCMNMPIPLYRYTWLETRIINSLEV